jgi:hypothetical protein
MVGWLHGWLVLDVYFDGSVKEEAALTSPSAAAANSSHAAGVVEAPAPAARALVHATRRGAAGARVGGAARAGRGAGAPAARGAAEAGVARTCAPARGEAVRVAIWNWCRSGGVDLDV